MNKYEERVNTMMNKKKKKKTVLDSTYLDITITDISNDITLKKSTQMALILVKQVTNTNNSNNTNDDDDDDDGKRRTKRRTGKNNEDDDDDDINSNSNVNNSTLTGEAKLIERRKRREQLNEERIKRVEERKMKEKGTKARERLDPKTWNNLTVMIGGRVEQPQDVQRAIFNRKKKLERAEVVQKMKGRRPCYGKKNECSYSSSHLTTTMNSNNNRNAKAYIRGRMFYILQPALLVVA